MKPIFKAIVLFLLPFAAAIAQNSQPLNSADTAALRQKYPDEYAAYLERSEHLRIDYHNQTWDISKDITEELVCLS